MWERELGPLLSEADVAELLGVSIEAVADRVGQRRLIALPDSGGARRLPAFQFHEGQPLADVIAAFWKVADVSTSPWTAASWCVATDIALDGHSPVQWSIARRDAGRLLRIAHRDAARLAA